MKTIATFIAGIALGAALLGALRSASATAAADDRWARAQVDALKDIASELRSMGRECRR